MSSELAKFFKMIQNIRLRKCDPLLLCKTLLGNTLNQNKKKCKKGEQCSSFIQCR